LRFLRLGILWFVLFVLAAFVFFVEFVAKVPGNAEPVPRPTPPVSMFVPAPSFPIQSQLSDSSSNTKSPLS
jgi:hypothetical protein